MRRRGTSAEDEHKGKVQNRRTTLLSIERFLGTLPGNSDVGLLLETKIPHTQIKAGQTTWLVHSPRWKSAASSAGFAV